MFLRSICLAALLFNASNQIAAADSPTVPAAGAPPAALVSPDYVLQPYDLIQVVVFQELDLDREVRLAQDGTISLPLIGSIDLTGKTVREAQDIVRRLYDKDYLVNPQINITVKEYAKETVNVMGAVNKPGAIDIPQDQPLRLLDAITRAEGFNRLADRKHVKLTRPGVDGKTTTIVINADDIIQSNSTDTWILLKGDVIFVPERIL